MKITANMKIELEIEQENKGNLHGKTTLYSVVEEIGEDGGLLIHTPVYQRKRYALPDNVIIILRFSIGSNVYVAPVIYAGRVKIGNTEYEKLRQIGDIHLNQRTDYRFPVTLPVTVERLNADYANKPIKGQTVNISGGGMLLSVSEDIGINERLAFVFNTGNLETVEGTVLRSEKTNSEKYPYKISVQFAFKIPQHKQRLNKFIADQQQSAIEKIREGLNG